LKQTNISPYFLNYNHHNKILTAKHWQTELWKTDTWLVICVPHKNCNSWLIYIFSFQNLITESA